MASLRVSGRQHGAVAVEFALVAPLFFALVAATVYLGLALYTKLLVLNAANTAVRTCVIKQVGYHSDGEFSSCANTEFTNLTGPAGNLAVACNGGAPQVQSSTQTISNGRLQSYVKVLKLDVTCQVGLSRVMWMAGNGAGNDLLTLKIASSMPYSLSRQPN